MRIIYSISLHPPQCDFYIVKIQYELNSRAVTFDFGWLHNFSIESGAVAYLVSFCSWIHIITFYLFHENTHFIERNALTPNGSNCKVSRVIIIVIVAALVLTLLISLLLFQQREEPRSGAKMRTDVTFCKFHFWLLLLFQLVCLEMTGGSPCDRM